MDTREANPADIKPTEAEEAVPSVINRQTEIVKSPKVGISITGVSLS